MVFFRNCRVSSALESSCAYRVTAVLDLRQYCGRDDYRRTRFNEKPIGQTRPELHQTKKGKSWHFAMKMHIGTDDVLGMINSIRTTPANTHALTQASHLRHGQEQRVWSDAGYSGIEQRDEHRGRRVEWFIALRPGMRRQLVEDSPTARDETTKAQVRTKVEHPFL